MPEWRKVASFGHTGHDVTSGISEKETIAETKLTRDQSSPLIHYLLSRYLKRIGFFSLFEFLARAGLRLLAYLVRARNKPKISGSGFSPINLY